MQSLINLLLILPLAMSGHSVLGQNKTKEQQTPPPSQTSPEAQGQASGSAVYKSITGCVERRDQGFFLTTDGDSYLIDTDEDLSPYVNKQVNLTGILEHENGDAPSAESGSAAVITDVRIRMIARVIGDCNQPSK
jgi:hypothetical protein